MNWKYWAYKQLADHLRKAALTRKYQNLAWVMQWNITYVCPLTCSYCLVPHHQQHGDMEKALGQVRRLRPKYLIITGGEPILAPDIVSAMRTVKEEWNPLTMMTTSLVGPFDTVLQLLDYIDVIHVSLDGVGDEHQQNRGYRSGPILEKVERLAAEISARGRHDHLLILCVLTPHNYRKTRELVEHLHKIAPGILISFGSVEPETHELSLTHYPEMMAELLPELRALQAEYRVHVVGPLGQRLAQANRSEAAPAARHGNGAYYCPRQYFRIMLDPYGKLLTCKDSRLLNDGLDVLETSLREGRYRKAAGDLGYLLDILYFHPNSAECRSPCKCEEFVDDMIMSREGQAPTPETLMLEDRFTTPELDTAEAYIKHHFNPNWNPAVRQILERP